MDNIWIFDVEGDGLTPTKLHCLAATQPKSGKVFVTSSYDDMRKFLKSAKVIIGHNIQRFDVPVLERILGIKIECKLIDTLALSWYLYPNRFQHGLEAWGEDLGIKKPEIEDWSGLSQEEYEHRCKEDVKINQLLWNKMYQYLLDIYGSNESIWILLDYIAFKMHCAVLQEKSGWKIDIDYVKKNLAELEEIQKEKIDTLSKVMPRVPSISKKTKPKRFINKDGSYSKLGMEWIKLLSSKNLPVTYEGEIEIIKGYEDGNPNSTDQLKDWLTSLGWKPRTFKHVKNKETGITKDVPQINLEHGKGICESIKELYEIEPNLELLDGLSVLQHRIGILNGFLRDEKDGRLKAQVKGFTNTLRFQHTTIVNLPKVDKLYAASIRGSLVADDDKILCGSDLSSLEDRLKQHFIYSYDPEFVKEMMKDDFDPHLDLALIAGVVTTQQVENYKSKKDLSIKPIRDMYKTGNYALQYKAGVSKLSISLGISFMEAKKIFDAYWNRNWAVKKVAEDQKYKVIDDQMWLFNPISKIWYTLRFEKDIFSTLIQGTGSYIFDMWVKKIMNKREQLTGQFHDEFIICISKGYNEQCKILIKNSLNELNEELKLNRKLDCDVQFGERYSLIH